MKYGISGKMRKIIPVLAMSMAMCKGVCAQVVQVKRVEPLNWWTGMKNSQVQLLVYGEHIGSAHVQMNYPGVVLRGVHQVENPNYLFVDLDISPLAKPGFIHLMFSSGKDAATYDFELKARTPRAGRNMGVTQADIIYLIMPDRFSNGDVANDKIAGMQEQTLDRDSMYYRHGGDIQGVINHLDYLKNAGITAIWMTPEIENDMPHASYHGYAATDLYKIDPRYGTNELYRSYVEQAHNKGLKVIKDVVPNHCGTEHWFIKDMPMKEWVNQWPVYTNTNYRDQPVMDPHASEADRKKMTDGWFVPTMADMNERNPYVAKYLTQNYIWWLEYAGIDGLRIDTYPYNDPVFMASWAQAVKKEYPDVSIFGETLVNSVPELVFFTEGNTANRGFDTHLPGVTDVQVKDAIYEAVNGKPGWNDGVNRLYSILAQDFLYKDPTRNVIFMDNHDMSRFYSMVNEDFGKYKAALALLLTMRGIPQVYYGTEILMKNFSDPDGKVREDFKGGWQGDKTDKFTSGGRTAQENEAFSYFKNLATYRSHSGALQHGKLMQYVPENNVYVYFRYDAQQTVMIAFNSGDKDAVLKATSFEERTKGFTKAKNIIDHTEVPDISNISVPAKTVKIFELIR
ncbi:glycoside hydrolase family 13 protein [Chitinophagaceae bacterium MMS25-I14]